MRYILVLVLVFILINGGKALADELLTIFVKEASYSINSSSKELNSAELESELKQLKFSQVSLDINYCAGPDRVAEVYVAIANAKPSVTDIHLKTSGNDAQGRCDTK